MQPMIYTFQVIPLDDLEKYMGILLKLEAPIDRHEALKVGACALLVESMAESCIAGIDEEKRLLRIWVRNKRSAIRLIRGKGSSKIRDGSNAMLSNASDNALN